MPDLKPGDVVTVEEATVEELLDEADASLARVPNLAALNAADRELVAAMCSVMNALRAVNARLRKAGM